MPTFNTFTVARELEARPGLQRVELHDGSRAYALTDLVGSVAVGDEVVVNTTAVDLGLGTGGWHVIHWNLAHRSLAAPRAGHVLKLRYTSLQAATGAAIEDHELTPEALAGVPVVATTLHSQLPGVLAGAALVGAPRAAFVMSGGGALPLALSDLVVALRETGLLAGTVTAGHAFGGDLEAVGLADALCLAAGQLGAALVVVGPGPGLVGTGTALGTTALDAVAALDLAAALGARPVLCVRASAEEPRARHRGISHHTATVARLVRSPVDLPVPSSLEAAAAVLAAERDPTLAPHRLVVTEDPGAAAVLAAQHLTLTTMGRDATADELFLPAAAAAGAYAAGLVGTTRNQASQ